MSHEFTIDADQMPSKALSISFREPLFKDRRECARRYPMNGRVGYSLEEMMLASALTGINSQALPAIPRDPMHYLGELPHVDSQYLVSVFLSMFTLDDDMAESAKALGSDMKIQLAQTHTISQEAMPSGQFSVTFKTPVHGDRQEVDRRYPGADSNCGYSLEEMLFASCLVAVNGQPVTPSKDAISILDEWTHLDAQYALAVFINAVTINNQDVKDAKALGKSLRAGRKAVSTPSAKSAGKKEAATTTSA